MLYTVESGDSMSRISNLYDIEISEITEKNDLNNNEGLKIGQKLILPGASKITYSSSNTSSNTTTNTNTSNTSNTNTNTSNKVPAATAVDSTSMVWPTEGHRITQYFNWSHNGLDIANKIGTPIYAADAGTVEIAATGWNGGYGNTFLINHGNGKKTRYGHLTSLYVKSGDTVTKGENIGAMGSTGRSTGPHIHFEVVINGTRYNPLNYIKY
ncbi:MAG: LysM peptidoglycan-binding domain-containing M23 family metallopeptidase [Patescibacteria group bacterium]|nr:LysM peptidoglycan-binding domain-containing M23 family metallopeptidase [Patescibacteria group bacterium]